MLFVELNIISDMRLIIPRSRYTITNLDLVINITSMPHSLHTLSLVIKVLALLFIRLYLSKASQASVLGLNDFCVYFLALINM
jgi:hypothetical protein